MKCNYWLQALGQKWIPQRYCLTFLSFLGVVIAFSLRTYMSMVIITNQGTCFHVKQNSNNTTKTNSDIDKFKEDGIKQAFLLSSFYIGYLLTHLPGAYISRKFGGKYTLGIGLLASSLLSILTVPIANLSSVGVILTRLAMGLAEGPTFPALSELLSQWAPPSERTLLSSIIFAGVQVGTVVSLAVSGWLLETMECPYVFYIFGIAGICWFFFWVFLCYNKPSVHPFISPAELQFISQNILESDKTMSTPWKAILMSTPVWVLIIAEMGHDYAFYTTVSDLPKYYNDTSNYHISQIGVLTGLPYISMWLTSVMLGYLCDKIIELKHPKYSRTRLRCHLAAIGAVIPGTGLVCASYIENEKGKITLVTISVTFMACCYSSIRVNPLDLSPNHAATIMAIVNGAGSLSGFVAPFVVGFIVKYNPVSEWRIVFWIVLAVLIFTSLPFVFWASADVQIWDKPEEEPTVSDLRRRSTISGGEPIREKYRNYYPENSVIEE